MLPNSEIYFFRFKKSAVLSVCANELTSDRFLGIISPTPFCVKVVSTKYKEQMYVLLHHDVPSSAHTFPYINL